MVKIIAFSGNSNTGKTSAMHMLKKTYLKKNKDLRIQIFNETAREYIDLHGGVVDDVREFEIYIADQEMKRIERLKEIKKSDSHDLVFIDRTSLDGVIYSFRNLVNGDLPNIDYFQDYSVYLKASKDLYDHVVFFSTPIKKDSRFQIYNNEHINTVFEHTVRFWYGEKVLLYTNNIEFQSNITSSIFDNIFDF